MSGFKPCPFCGNKNIEIVSRETFDRTRNDFDRLGYCDNSIMVSCNRCSTDMFLNVSFSTDYEEAVEMAKEKWNTREVFE